MSNKLHAHDRLEKIEVASHEELQQWFRDHHTQQESIWLVPHKKVVLKKYVANTDIVYECVCFGWMENIA